MTLKIHKIYECKGDEMNKRIKSAATIAVAVTMLSGCGKNSFRDYPEINFIPFDSEFTEDDSEMPLMGIPAGPSAVWGNIGSDGFVNVDPVTGDEVGIVGANTKSEIFEAFQEAYNFYYSWIYGQAYVDWDSVDEKTLTGRVNHDTIKTATGLKEKIYSLFPKPQADEYIARIAPEDRNGDLYIKTNGGVGDDGFDFSSYHAHKIDDNTYVVTIYLFDMYTDSNFKTQVLCTIENGNYLFENYKDSLLKDAENYVECFE